MRTKYPTPDQKLRKLIKLNTTLQNALLCERIALICDLSTEELNRLKAQGKPFSPLGFIPNYVYEELFTNVKEVLNYPHEEEEEHEATTPHHHTLD